MIQGNEMERRILAAAGDGEDLPAPGTPMGVVLAAIAVPGGESYDPRFAETLAGMRPDWFEGASLAKPGPGRTARRF